ncbi:MAG: DUF1819 family protein [Fimbriimonadaceae bacterium]|nr:DUF1819 family protein [Fimbriimonadaceae bacterium]
MTFTGNIQKGGAMLDDTRRFLEAWDTSLDSAANIRRIADGNLLGKTSRKRSDDVLLRILVPRFVDPGPDVVPALRALRDEPRAFREACFYETARDDGLLAACAQGPIWTWYSEGRIGVAVDDVKIWLKDQTDRGNLKELTDTVRTKVARGLLAALRDFGILRGTIRKEFNSPGMSAKGFAYVAFRETQQGAGARALVDSPIWHRWLLDDRWVADLLAKADRIGVLRHSQVGSAVRIDWNAATLQEVVDAAA